MNRHWETLEFPKILARLAKYTDFSAGAELALALTPAPDYREARERLTLTAEARALFVARPDFALGGITDIRPWVEQARHDVLIMPREMLQVRDTLLGAERVYRLLTRLESQFPHLADIAWRITPQPQLVAAINRVLDERGEVRDTASPELARIRHDLRVAQERIQERLRRMVTSPEIARSLQDTVITRREGRFVIPVQANFKGQVPGVVHDRSATGMTLFMEPLAVVELNNALRELTLAEEEEVYRILAALTREVADAGMALDALIAALAELDLALALARYAEELQATQPELLPLPHPLPEVTDDNYSAGAVLRLEGARHPLLDPQKVVPVDIVLNPETHILIVTGPNTGGKTVSLKTAGLLVLMAQSGMHLPADAGSALSYFEAVYADIGDEQSIEQSLSTFSSHLANIVSFLERIDYRALVLLDELGAGTDPAEGSALARALLEHIRKRRGMAFVATHYPELKLYAHNTPGVQNASMEFDTETLAPTYRLILGLPGRSNAFAIARRLGMPEDVIKLAQGMLSGEELRVEDMLEDLHTLRLEAVRARDAARQARHEAQVLGTNLRKRLAGIEEERHVILQEARDLADAEVEAVRQELEEVRRRLRVEPSRVTRDTLAQVVAGATANLAEVAGRTSELVQESLGDAALEAALEPMAEAAVPAGPPRPGDTVRLATLGLEGVLVRVDGDEALVQAGPVRTRVPFGSLTLVRREKPPAPEVSISVPEAGPSPGLQLDLRGLTAEEALLRLDRYLDQAVRARLPWVRIVHGKGTGTLRREVRRMLGEHPLVVSYESATERDGGDGVTLAQLLKA